MSLYQYEELDQGPVHMSRLRTLHPGQPKEPVCISLRVSRLDGSSLLSYEALSYTWGSTVDFVPIDVYTGPNTVLQIHLRQSSLGRVLWIDSICINKSDLEERSAQVAEVSNIYRRAQRVLVWLGPEREESSYAFDLLDNLRSQLVSIDFKTYTVVSKNPDKKPEFTYTGYEEVLALSKLIHRPWFERLWVRQEVWLANEENVLVLCGHRTMAWPAFKNAVGAIWLTGPDPYPKGGGALAERAKWHERMKLLWQLVRPPNLTVLNLQDRLQGVKCSDPRDMIYRILALLDRQSSELGIEPKTTRSRPPKCTKML
ncbi:heterokaryon incompatibility protein-domain-containing protein [Podospora didyma]|uniref:Heterokaryon incompatibility protein-domain-containing protein n=1 Tax=Podospora didyma TaxID=330526 RepID=A0AAE0K6D8_9PEZI|nr:heterokaryon incompatibility protein-domain-containing protein [Podospora didyma]